VNKQIIRKKNTTTSHCRLHLLRGDGILEFVELIYRLLKGGLLTPVLLTPAVNAKNEEIHL